MTFEEYIKNPSGTGSSVITNRQMYDDLYLRKFNLIMLREGNKFKWTCYKTKDKDRYIIHIKVPSEVVPKFYYDVVIEFSAPDAALLTATSLNRYNIRVFTNSPDFMYTHCHAFVKNNMFFADLSPKMPKDSLRKVAKERNPQDAMSYVKSLYFAYLIMKQFNLFNKNNYVMVDTYNKGVLLREVMSAEEKTQLRQSLGEEERQKKKRDNQLERRKQQEQSNTGGNPQRNNKIYTKKTPTTTKASSNQVYTKRTKKTKYSK